ncbi:Ppx/GppA family phosphatase, partial [Streptomyces sp. NPDC003233]
MRVSVLDAGSNTVRLVIADVEDGVPLPVHTVKWKLRLSEHVGPDDTIADEAVERLVKAVGAAGATARRWHAPPTAPAGPPRHDGDADAARVRAQRDPRRLP